MDPLVIEARALPRHVAIIMDGNGRWAEARGLSRSEGHRAGSEAVRRTVRAARRLGIRALTLFAFSEQNWSRPTGEVDALMGLLRDFLVSEREEILGHGIRLRAIGDTSRLPPSVRSVLEPLEAASGDHQGLLLTLALSYGGREEILAAARDIARRAASGALDPDSVNMAVLNDAIPSVAPGPADLLIRTGGELRISNFLLWGAAYAELFFSPTLWPDYGAQDLYAAVQAYQSRERRFGLTSAQLRAEAPVTTPDRDSTTPSSVRSPATSGTGPSHPARVPTSASTAR